MRKATKKNITEDFYFMKSFGQIYVIKHRYQLLGSTGEGADHKMNK